MAKYRVNAPDGSVFEVNAPDGASEADVMAYAKGEFAKQTPTITKPTSVKVGETLGGIPRQIGLAARYGIEGLAGNAQIVTEPLRLLTDAITPDRAPSMSQLVTGDRTPKSTPLSVQATKFADMIGLPSPQGADERVVGDATRFVASGAGLAKGAGVAANFLSGTAKNVANMFAANPVQQLVSAAGAGGAGGSVREAGGGDLAQFAAALGGGVATPLATNAIAGVATKGANAVRQALTPASVEMARADQQISLVLQRSGIDWSAVPERIRQSMRQEVSDALNTGNQLNPAALRRLLVFREANATPTVGQLTQDPGMITREKNLSKAGANSTNPAMQTLPSLENRNVASFLRQLDEAGAAGAPSASGAARTAIDSMGGTVRGARANIDALYGRARDTQGRSVVLDGPAAMNEANNRLVRDGVGKLPAEVDQIMNDIATGKTPLTVDYQQQLLKNFYRKMTGAGDNGDLRHGLRILRSVLDDVDVLPNPVNPGNLPAVRGTVPRSDAITGQESIDAYRAARTANREWQTRVEANPALQAVVDGVEPDQFVQQYVIGKGATAKDVASLRNELDPGAVAQMRAYLVRHLKAAATGGDEDITKFGGKSYRNALRDLEDKLPVFFSAAEIKQMRDIGNAAKYMQAQPAGSAVNNSNSGALIIGRGLDMLEQAAQKLPVGRDAITGVIQGMQQRQVMAPKNALQLLAPKQAANKGNALLALPIVAAGQRPEDR